MSEKLRVLILAPGCDGTDVGESWSCFQWVQGLARHCQITLLTLQRHGRPSIAAQLPEVEIVTWPDWNWGGRLERFTSMFKPGYLRFYHSARRWIARSVRQGRGFDLIHQLGPLALRYPSPGTDFGIPLVLGPYAGSLETPPAFSAECRGAPWYVRFRSIDRLRLRFDPWLRRSYASADAVIGVAPYVAGLLESIAISRFEVDGETGVHRVVCRAKPSRDQRLRLLYVGRVIRTKGLRDAIRAMALLSDLPGVTLDAIGTGEDLEFCRQLSNELGLAERVRFHGRLSRSDVDHYYDEADAFLFPSFREPSGNVVFEALSHGLPVITTDRGGPGYVVNDDSGIRVRAESPEQLARDLADAVRILAQDAELRRRLSWGAAARACDIGLWENKIRRMYALYQSVVANHRAQSAVNEL